MYKGPDGYRVAVEVYGGGTSGCPILEGGSKNSGSGTSDFTKISAIHQYMDITAGQNFRIDTRQVP